MSSTSAPPPSFYSQQQFFNQPTGNSAFSPAAIAIISLLGLAFLIVSYHTAIAKFWTGSRGAFRRPGVSDEPGDPQEGATAFLTRGLEESVIQAIPVYTYSKDDGLVDGSECSVCLGEFQNDESLRLLPKCNHAFHLSCIDQWLQSHSNCPLCRSNISDPALPRQPDSPARPATVVTGEDYANAEQDMQIMHEAGNSAHLRDCSDQRSSELRAYNPNDPQFTSFPEGEGTPRAEGPGTVDVSTRLNAPSLEDKINGRNTECYHDLQEQTSLVDLKSFSKDRAFIFGKDRKLPIVSRRRDGDATTIIQRSSSMDSIYYRPEVGLERCKQTIVYDLFPRNQVPQPLWYQPQDENAALSTTDIASVSVVVDMDTTGSSSSKTESVIGHHLEKRLLSFKARPFIVKRSFSGGGLFWFRSKSTAGIVNTGLPV